MWLLPFSLTKPPLHPFSLFFCFFAGFEDPKQLIFLWMDIFRFCHHFLVCLSLFLSLLPPSFPSPSSPTTAGDTHICGPTEFFFSIRHYHSPHFFSSWGGKSKSTHFGCFSMHTDFAGRLARWVLSPPFCEGSHLASLPAKSVYCFDPMNWMQFNSPPYGLKMSGEWNSLT